MKMTTAELRSKVDQMFKEQIVPEYASRSFENRADWLYRCIDDMEQSAEGEWSEDADERIIESAEEYIEREYTAMLNPATAVVGEGATVCLYSDCHAYTIIAKSKTGKKLTLRQCKATLDPTFVPSFDNGGFAGHCNNQNDQSYSYEEDPEGEVVFAHWSDRERRYKADGLHVIKGRHEFYDYNF